MEDFNSYELEIAKLLSDHPGIICLDVLGIFDLVKDPINPMIDMLVENLSDTFNHNTVQVDVCQVDLPTKKQRETLDRKFIFRFMFKVASKDTFKTPDAETVLIDNNPVTEEDVIDICKLYLGMIEYKFDYFLFGTRIIRLDEDD